MAQAKRKEDCWGASTSWAVALLLAAIAQPVACGRATSSEPLDPSDLAEYAGGCSEDSDCVVLERIVSINGLAARIKPARAGETAGETAGRRSLPTYVS